MQLLKSHEIDYLDTILMFGAGSKQRVKDVLAGTCNDNVIIIFEPDEDKVPEIPRRVLWFKEPDSIDMSSRIRGNAEHIMTNLHILVDWRTLEAHLDEFKEMFKVFNEAWRGGVVTLRTGFILAAKSTDNRFDSFKRYVNSLSLKAYKDCAKGIPGIVVSAGPSLQKNIRLLKDFNAVKVATPPTVKVLLDNGTVPDFACFLDFHEESQAYFDGFKDQQDKVTLIGAAVGSHAVTNAYTGPLAMYDDYLMRMILGDSLPDKGNLNAGATVAYMAYHLCVYFGCDPILFVGQDLSYSPDGRYHIKGVTEPEARKGEHKRDRDYTFEEMKKIGGRYIECVDMFGNQVMSEPNMLSYKLDLEKAIDEFKGDVYNCTEGGLGMIGADNMPLEEALSKFSKPYTLNPKHEPVDLQAVKDKVNDQVRRIKELRKLYEATLAIMKRVLNRVKKGKMSENLIGEARKMNPEIERYKDIQNIITDVIRADIRSRTIADKYRTHEIEKYFRWKDYKNQDAATSLANNIIANRKSKNERFIDQADWLEVKRMESERDCMYISALLAGARYLEKNMIKVASNL